ncbi:MAG: cation diffusion facilitator family transporter, partial [Glaciimonas sp.]|nr:cation diffusion facilitator family transporter [Glaciimonas sp.]
IAKFAASLFTGSGAMLAEAIHSLADCTNQIFLLIGLKEAKKPATNAHPMGYARVVYFWAMIVALLLFFMGGAFSVTQGIKHWQHPEPISSQWVAMLVLGISIILESFSLYGAMVEIRKISNGKPFLKWFRETRQSELMVVAGEDIAALAGLVIAFVAVLLTSITGNPIWDACGSIAVGILLMIIAVAIVREVKAMVTGESAAPEVHAAIKNHIETQPEVARIINLISIQWGDHVMLAVQAEMRPQPSAQFADKALVDVINRIEASIQAQWPQVKWC